MVAKPSKRHECIALPVTHVHPVRLQTDDDGGDGVGLRWVFAKLRNTNSTRFKSLTNQRINRSKGGIAGGGRDNGAAVDKAAGQRVRGEARCGGGL